MSAFHDGTAMVLEPAVPFVVLGEDAEDFIIKPLRMVHLLQMAELVNDDAVDHLDRGQHQQAVKAQVPFRTAAAPAAFLGADGDPARAGADKGSVNSDPLGNVLLRSPGKGLQVLL